MSKHRDPDTTSSTAACLTPAEPGSTPYGRALAEAVANQLVKESAGLVNNHRDYCGKGLDYARAGTCDFDGLTGASSAPSTVAQYRYGYVRDGRLDKAELAFTEREAFIAWLAQQSDRSLYGFDEPSWALGNQRLTRERLEEFVKWADGSAT